MWSQVQSATTKEISSLFDEYDEVEELWSARTYDTENKTNKNTQLQFFVMIQKGTVLKSNSTNLNGMLLFEYIVSKKNKKQTKINH